MHRQIILDTETTGLLTTAGHRIIEIGCVEMVNRRFTGRRLHYYVNPQRPVDKEALTVHGLTDEFLKDKPLFSTIIEELLQFISGAELIIHNAAFDIGFLNYELELLKHQAAPIERHCKVIDTLLLARHKHPGQSNSLDALCKRYQVDNSNRDLHGALIDAQLLGQVYLALTGGQEQLFATDSLETAAPMAEIIQRGDPLKTQRQPLPVIPPTLEDLEHHQAFLALLKKTGRCLWEQ